MALSKRHLVLTSRLAALAGMVMLRGWPRIGAWATHDFLWLYPTLRQNCGWHGEVLTHFETGHREVWLTIDDGPDPRDTPAILDLLAQHNALATFFLIGKKVDRHRSLTRQIAQAGHTLGNHTHSHPASSWWALPRPLIERQIARGGESLLVATGRRPQWFRSPVGMNNFSVHPCAHAAGQRVVGWSASGLDGAPGAHPRRVIPRLMSAVRPGAILLIHESGDSPLRVRTLACLLDRLAEEGYRCVLPHDSSLR